MKSFAKVILVLAVSLLYVVSTMGYGVHRCVVDGTASVVLLFGEAPCDYAHQHEQHGDGECGHRHGESHDCSSHENHEHDGNCCSTSVYVLTQDQDTVQDTHFDVPVADCISPAYDCTADILSADLDSNDWFRESSGDVTLPGPAQALFCIFRV